MTIEMSRSQIRFPQYAKQASVLRDTIMNWLSDKLELFDGDVSIKNIIVPFFVNEKNVKFAVSIELACHNDEGDFVLAWVNRRVMLDDNLFIFSDPSDFGKAKLNPFINLSELCFTREVEDGVVSVKPSARKIMVEISVKHQPVFECKSEN
jgi:hypothetical protein|nr:MAG TPA: hypothetical protein [Caudoviricetes sp.]